MSFGMCISQSLVAPSVILAVHFLPLQLLSYFVDHIFTKSQPFSAVDFCGEQQVPGQLFTHVAPVVASQHLCSSCFPG